jgi:hypothetical protein
VHEFRVASLQVSSSVYTAAGKDSLEDLTGKIDEESFEKKKKRVKTKKTMM